MAKFSGFFPEPKNGGVSVGYLQDMVVKPIEEKVLKKLSMLDSLRKNSAVTSALAYANGIKDVAMAQIKQEPVVKHNHEEEVVSESNNSMKL